MEIGLIAHFKNLPDPRVERTRRYPLMEIVFLIISATVSGCEGWKEIKDFGEVKLEWLRKFLPYEQGIPVDDTIARVMRKLNTKAFQNCFMQWIQSVAELTEGAVIAIDGKTLRRSHNRKTGLPAIHMVSAWCSSKGLVLGQEKTAEKSNEITAIPELLKMLEIKGCIVTIDAMGCQTAIAEQIIKQKADYLLAVKGNQGTLHEEIKEFFDVAIANDFKNVTHEFHEEFDAGHGRVEHRQCFTVSANPAHFPAGEKWKNLNSITMVKSKREMPDKTTNDTRFYISSLLPDAKKLLSASRKHWGVENSLQWTLDVTFREDESRVRTEASPENFAIMRHIALNIIRRDSSMKNASVKRKRLQAALNDNYREALMKQVI